MVGATVWQINFYRLLALRLLVFLYLLFRYRGCSGTRLWVCCLFRSRVSSLLVWPRWSESSLT